MSYKIGSSEYEIFPYSMSLQEIASSQGVPIQAIKREWSERAAEDWDDKCFELHKSGDRKGKPYRSGLGVGQ